MRELKPQEAKELLELIESGDLLTVECEVCGRPISKHSHEEVLACETELIKRYAK